MTDVAYPQSTSITTYAQNAILQHLHINLCPACSYMPVHREASKGSANQSPACVVEQQNCQLTNGRFSTPLCFRNGVDVQQQLNEYI